MAETRGKFASPALERVECEVEIVVSLADTGPEGTKVFTFRWGSGSGKIRDRAPTS